MYIKRFINYLGRRTEYVFYSAYGLLFAICIALAFWPKPAEHFETFVPPPIVVLQSSGEKISIQFVRFYGEGKLKKPVAVYVDGKNLYVSDAATNSVKIISRKDKFVAEILRTSKNKQSILEYPFGLTGYDADKFVIAESGGKERLLLFDRQGNFSREVTSKGSIEKPGYLLSANKKLYVADLAKHDIKILDEKFKVIGSIAKPTNNIPLLKAPQGMAADAQGNIWVADGGNERVACFDQEGRFLRSFDGSENNHARFVMVKGLAIVAKNLLCVSDPVANTIRIFDIADNLRELTGLDAQTNKFLYPMSLFVDGNKHLFICDRGHGRILEYAIK